jgi:hypothetical protein
MQGGAVVCLIEKLDVSHVILTANVSHVTAAAAAAAAAAFECFLLLRSNKGKAVQKRLKF